VVNFVFQAQSKHGISTVTAGLKNRSDVWAIYIKKQSLFKETQKLSQESCYKMYQVWKRHAFSSFILKTSLFKLFLSLSLGSPLSCVNKALIIIRIIHNNHNLILCFSAKRFQIILCEEWIEAFYVSSLTSATCKNHPQSSHSLSSLCPCQALLLPFSESKKGVNTGFCPFSKGWGGSC